MGSRIKNAPSGENTSPAGTEGVPLSGSKWISLTNVRLFVKALTDTLYSTFNHTHSDSDNGGVVSHSVLSSIGTGVHVPAYSSDSTEFFNGKGEWAIPTGGSSGALVLLEQHTASASASLNFTSSISSTYDVYLIEIVGIVPATNATALLARVSTDGGSSYDSGANYYWMGFYYYAAGTGIAAGSGGSKTSFQIQGAIDGSTAHGVSGSMKLYPSDGTRYTRVKSDTSTLDTNASLLANFEMTMEHLSATAINAIQFFMSSGNIASGTIRIYGIAK